MWKQLTRIGSMKPGETQLPSLMFDLFASLSKREYVQAKVPHRTIETSRYASNQHQRSFDDNVWVDVYDPNSKKKKKKQISNAFSSRQRTLCARTQISRAIHRKELLKGSVFPRVS